MDVGQNPVPPVNLKVDGHPLYHMISRFWPIPISLLYDVIHYAYSVSHAHQKNTHHQMQSFYHSNPIMI